MAATIKDNANLGLKIVEGTENAGSPYGLAIHKADRQEFLNLFNKGLKNIKANGKYDEILKKYLG